MSTPANPVTSAAVVAPDDDQAIQDSIAQYTQQELQKQNSALQANIAAAAEKDPNVTAEAQRLGLQVGVGADIAGRNMAIVRKMAMVQDVSAQNLPQTAPKLAKLLEDPNFSGVAYDDIGNLSRIEQGAATVRAMSPMESFSAKYEFPVNKALMEYPLTRVASEAVGGTAEMLGDIGSFLGWHGNGPTRQNWLQRQAQADEPETYGLESNDLDVLAKNVAPVLATMPLTMGAGLAARALGLSENAAKVLSAASVGSAFTADQGGRTFTQMAAAGKSDAEARRDAMLVAGVNAPLNMAMGLTDFVPGLRDYPMLSALGIGAGTGATGQAVQNYITGQPLGAGVVKGALQGAAVQGGMHLGFGALDSGFHGELGEITNAVEASKLRTRAPQAFQQAMDANFDGDESLRIPAQDFVSYFAGKKIDPAVAANQLGVTDLAEAAEAGSDLEVPKANFFGKLDPEHQEGLQPDIVDPATELTPRQAEAGKQELQDWIANEGPAKLQAEYAQADAETQATPEWQQVKATLAKQYTDAGVDPSQAEAAATLEANRYAWAARNSGLKPTELLSMFGTNVVRGDAKYPATMDADRIAATVHPNARGDSGSEPIVVRNPNADKNETLYQAAPGKFVEYVKNGKDVDYEATAKSLPEVPEGHVRLFRSESPTTKFDDVFDKSKLGDFSKNRPNGQSYTDDLSYADYYRETYGKDARTHYVDVPEAVAERAKLAGGEYVLNAGDINGSDVPHQSANEGTRGWFRELLNGRFELGLTKTSDFSSLIHEGSHRFLKMMDVLSRREGASDRLKSDYGKILDWLGAKDFASLTREQHEQFARANEKYVREGIAPSAELRPVFRRAALWLQKIYRNARDLGVEFPSDVRGIFDRQFAADTAVDRAEQELPRQQLFENPGEAGWTDAEYRNYAEAKGIEVDRAREQVQAEMNEAAEREKTQAFRQEKGDIRDAMTEQIDTRPEYRAIRALRKGSLEDGTPITLNRDALVKQFGEERVKALQDLHRGLYRNEGGTDAETAAEVFGFNSGEEMMRALEAAPRRAQAIEAGTRDYLVNKYGDVRYDGSLMDKARFALENQERAKTIYREMKALRERVASLMKKAADAKEAMRSVAIAPLEHYQEAARQMVDQKAIADLQPYRYLEASRKYSREAFDALRKGNARAAADAKNKELLNHFLFREASAGRDYAGKFESYAKRMQSRGIQQRLGLAGSDYREQFNWLMARYKMGPLPVAPERSLRAWAEDVYGAGNEPAIAPGILNEGRFADYRNVPLSEIHDVHDALVNIRHLAMQEFKMFVQGRQVAFAEARAAMVDAARENNESKPVPVLKRKSKVPAVVQGFLNSVTASTRMEFLINRLDGGAEGPWHDNLWNPYEDSKGEEFRLQHDVTRSLNDQLQAQAEREGLKLFDKVAVEGIPASESPTRKDLVSFAMNMGNEGNLDRLRKSFEYHGWDPAAVERIGGMLTHEEWGFVQRVWDTLKPLGERMNELEKRLTGLPPKMVEVTPFKVALDDGTEMDLAGGYFPIQIDPDYSLKGYNEDAAKVAGNLMETGYGRATTSRGYTKERTGFGGPLLFDYERVLSSHIAKASKDISHREFMLAANRLLTDPELRQALRETLGPAYEQQFMPWLRATVNDRNGSLDFGANDPRKFMGALRSNLVKAALAFKASTALLQFTHLPRIMLFTEPRAFTQAMVDFWKSPAEMTRQIRDLSPNEMRFRGDNLDRDYRAKLEEIAGKKNLSAAAIRFGYSAFKYIDHAISFPLWNSVYNQSFARHAEMSESDAQAAAVHEADSAVRMGLGTSTPGDLPPIMRSDDSLLQLETMLYGFYNLNWNIVRQKVAPEAAREMRAGNFGKAAAKLTAGAALAWFVPAILSSVVQGDGPKDGENPGLWAAKRSLFFAGGTLPWVKDVAGLFDHGSLNPLVALAERGKEDFVKAEKGDLDDAEMGIDALDLGGNVAGLPGTGELLHLARYAYRASRGKIENPSLYGAVVGGR